MLGTVRDSGVVPPKYRAWALAVDQRGHPTAARSLKKRLARAKKEVLATYPLPEFFVVGAPKSGTSSLYGYCRQHPNLFAPVIKETHYFACPEVKDTYYNVKFVERWDRYLELYAERRDERLAGDFSPSYLWNRFAAARIADAQPRARIIAVLRNPVERALSHYLMDRRSGYNPPRLMACMRKTAANRLFHKEYIEVGRYFDQIRRYFRVFGRERVWVGLYDDLRRNEKAFLKSLFHFLEVDDAVEFVPERRNVYQGMRWGFLEGGMRGKIVRRVGSAAPRFVREMLKKGLYRAQKPDFTRERERLWEYFREDVDRLERLLDRDLSLWRR